MWARDDQDTRRLVVLAPGQEPAAVTPPGLQVRGVLDVDGEVVLFAASAEPTEVELWTYGPSGLAGPARAAASKAAPGPAGPPCAGAATWRPTA